MSRRAVLAAALVLAGCGGTAGPPKIEGPFGAGRDQVWVVRARGRPKAVVAVLHGLARNSGLSMEPWLVHLAEHGDDVIYPRYEQPPPDPNARDGVVEGVRAGLARLGRPKAPLVLVGHSRGGRLAVEAAASLKPDGVIALFPGVINPAFEPPTRLDRIPSSTQIWLLVGDRDTTVGSSGALELYRRLRSFDFPAPNVHGGVVRSRAGFVATHDAPLRADGPTRRVLWARIDGLIARATAPT